MIRLKISLLEKEKLESLGLIAVQPELVPLENDRLYFKGVQQYTVLERHFNLLSGSLWDIELFVEKTKVNQQ